MSTRQADTNFLQLFRLIILASAVIHLLVVLVFVYSKHNPIDNRTTR